MKAAAGTPTGSRSGQRHRRLEGRHRVIGERPDGAAGEARHALGGLDPTARHEARGWRPADRRRRSSRSAGRGRRRAPSPAGSGSGRYRRAPRAAGAARRPGTSSDRGARRPRPIRAGRRAFPSSSRRKAPIGVSRSAGRVARSRIVSALAARRWACARLIGSAVVICGWPRRIKNDLRLRDERSCLPRCHPHSAMPHSRDRRAVHVSAVTDRRCPVSLALCAGAYWRLRLASPRVRSGGSRVHSPSSPLRLAPTAGSLGRRRDGYSSRSQPAVRDVRGVWTGLVRGVKRLYSSGTSVTHRARRRPGTRLE